MQVEESAGTARYRLLEPVRQYAAGRLAESGDEPSARTRHLHAYLDLAERAAPALRGPDQIAWLQRLEREQDNLRGALTWAREGGDAAAGLRLATALAPFWVARGYFSEGRRWLTSALAAVREGAASTASRARALTALGMLAQWQGDLDGAQAYLEQSLALARAGDDRRIVADALLWLGGVHRRRRAFDAAIPMLEESLALYRALEDTAGVAFALSNLGNLYLNAGDDARGSELLEESLPLLRALGDVRNLAMSLTMLSAQAQSTGNRQRTLAMLREGLAGLLEVGDRFLIVQSLYVFAWFAVESVPARAARLMGASEAIRESLGVALAPVNHIEQSIVAPIRARLSEAEMQEAWSAGRRLTPAQAVAEALADAAPDAASPPQRPRPSRGQEEPLTSREQAVARLLAHGQSDREIAAALGISPRTAGTHVQNLLGKLGLRSRWQVSERFAAAVPEQRSG